MTHPAGGTKFLVPFKNPSLRSPRILLQRKTRYFASIFFHRSNFTKFIKQEITISKNSIQTRNGGGRRGEIIIKETRQLEIYVREYLSLNKTERARVLISIARRQRRGAGGRKRRRGGYPASDKERARFSIRDHGTVNRARSVINRGEFVVINEARALSPRV